MKTKLLTQLILLSSLTFACGKQASSELDGASTKNRCQIAPTCDQTIPKFPAAKGFKNFYSKGLPVLRKALHRGRDVIAVEGQPIILQAKFSYGLMDMDLINENVDIYLSQGCKSGFTKIGSAITSVDGANPTTDSVPDTGGRVFVDLAKTSVKSLPVGRHRVLMVVTGDNSVAELYVNVIPRNSKVVVTDIDGTLTESEMAAATEIIGIQPKAHIGAAEMLKNLHSAGYSIFYLTARPEWLMNNTRAWLKAKGFPQGTIHTTNSPLGAQGEAASEYKITEIKQMTANTGIVPSFAFGNKESDAKAFGAAGINPASSYYFKLEGDALGGVVHSDYVALAKAAVKLPLVCR